MGPIDSYSVFSYDDWILYYLSENHRVYYGGFLMGKEVSEKEAVLYAAMIENTMDKWLSMTGRDEMPDELAEKTLKVMKDNV